MEKEDHTVIHDAAHAFDTLLGSHAAFPVHAVETVDEGKVDKVVEALVVVDERRTEELRTLANHIFDGSGGLLDLVKDFLVAETGHLLVGEGMVLDVAAERHSPLDVLLTLRNNLFAPEEERSRDVILFEKVKNERGGCWLGTVIEAESDVFSRDLRSLLLRTLDHLADAIADSKASCYEDGRDDD